jgi:uncharacterized membrane protein
LFESEIAFVFVGLVALVEIYFEHKQKLKTNSTLIWGGFIILASFLQAISFLLPVNPMALSFVIAGVCIILARPKK